MNRTLTSNCKICNKEYTYHPSNKRGIYCSNKCQSIERAAIANIKNQKLLEEGKLTQRGIIKKTLLSMGVEHKCSVCGLTDWMGKPISMVLDHINGRANDNSRDNLRLICHNCDAQSAHYKGRNRGNGRKSLGLQ